MHRGPHPIYNDMVRDHIGEIEQFMGEMSHIAFAGKIFTMLKSMRYMLTDSYSSITLNKRDPMSRQVDFKHLDADVDRLWAGIAKSPSDKSIKNNNFCDYNNQKIWAGISNVDRLMQQK